MAGLMKREISNKALRIDSRMANDIETLSKNTSYSQNDIIVLAIKQYLYENRQHYIRDMVVEKCLDPMDKSILTMRQEYHYEFDGMSIDVVKTAEANVYCAKVMVKNSFGEIIFNDERNVNITTKDWDIFKEYFYENILKYIDFNHPRVLSYFKDRFNYE